MYYRHLWLTLGWLYVLLIIYGSLIRVPDVNIYLNHTDKFIHFFIYLVMVGWFIQLYRLISQRVIVLGAAIILGIVIEYLQGLTDYRSFDVLDVLANSMGATTAFLLAGTSLARLLSRFDSWLYARIKPE